MEMPQKLYGLIARFRDCPELYNAAKKVRDAGFKKWDVFAPLPIHGMDAAMGLKRSKVPFFTFIGGATGLTIATLMIWYMNAYDYPLVVGGKPYFSPVFPFPVMYELTILLAAFGTLFGMFITNKLPRHNHPVFNLERFKRGSDDEFFIVIESKDPHFELEKTKGFLEEIGGLEITSLEN